MNSIKKVAASLLLGALSVVASSVNAAQAAEGLLAREESSVVSLGGERYRVLMLSSGGSITTQIIEDGERGIDVADSVYESRARFNRAELVNIYVRRQFRRKRIGQYLFLKNVEYAKQEGREKLVWKAVPLEDRPDDQRDGDAPFDAANMMPRMQSVVKFYQSLGATLSEDRIDKFVTPMEYAIKGSKQHKQLRRH